MLFFGMPEKIIEKTLMTAWILRARCWDYKLSDRRPRNCIHYSVCVLEFINNTIVIENKNFYIKKNFLKPNYLISSEAFGWSNFTLFREKLYLQSTFRSEMPTNFILFTLRDKIKWEGGKWKCNIIEYFFIKHLN